MPRLTIHQRVWICIEFARVNNAREVARRWEYQYLSGLFLVDPVNISFFIEGGGGGGELNRRNTVHVKYLSNRTPNGNKTDNLVYCQFCYHRGFCG